MAYAYQRFAFVGFLALAVFSTFPIRADISPTNVQEVNAFRQVIAPVNATQGLSLIHI